jgi:cbb3-type cytochrome oxidase subunit 3
VSLYDDYENEKLYGDNNHMSHSNNKLWYITIWGEGTYNLTIEWFPLLTEDEDDQDDDDDDDDDHDETDSGEGFEPLYAIGCVISSLMLPLMFIIILVLVLILIFKKGKKDEKVDEAGQGPNGESQALNNAEKEHG